MSDAFYKSSFFLNFLTLISDGDQLIQLLMRLDQFTCLINTVFA